MSSKNIYTSEKPYCVYLTIYSGNKLPPFYIGSSSVDTVINKNYHGSVSSKKYKDIWKQELKYHPKLFKTRIISYHGTRKNATEKEYKLQKSLNVVKSPMYINMAFAIENGFFGMDVHGVNNPRHRNNIDISILENTYILWTKDKLTIETGIYNICNKYNLAYSGVLNCIYKKSKSHRGWKIMEYTEELFNECRKTEFVFSCNKTIKSHIIISNTGNIHIVNNIRKFCREQNVALSTIINILNGTTKNSNLFNIYTYSEELYNTILNNISNYIPNRNKTYVNNSRNRIYEFIDSIGNKHITTNLKDFCISNKLNYDCMRHLDSNRIKSHKGWKLGLI